MGSDVALHVSSGSNTSCGDDPDSTVDIEMVNGFGTVAIGNTSILGMNAINDSVATNNSKNELRFWFCDLDAYERKADREHFRLSVYPAHGGNPAS